MKNSQFLLLVLLGLFTFLSCKKEDNINIYGTYTLTSITASQDLDLNGDGTFGDLELMDNVSCTSSLVLNTDGSFEWDSIFVGDYYDSVFTCSVYGPLTGSFQNNGTSIILNLDNNTEFLSVIEHSIIYQYANMYYVPDGIRIVSINFIYTK